jgi:hypothetical protein
MIISLKRARMITCALATAGSIGLTAASAAPTLAVSPPLSPGSGGPETVTNANGSPVTHLGPSSPGIAPPGLCFAESGFGPGSTVSGWAEGRCSESRTQEIEVCVEQNYNGSWHSSETCNVAGPAYKQFLRVNTKYSLVCTHGRKFRVWNWYYTPGTTPEITTGLYPTASGETRC